MAVNEVKLGNETIMSTRNDTVTPQTLVSGATAHNASGQQITGEFDPSVFVKTTANQGLTDIEKANARSNIGAGTSTAPNDAQKNVQSDWNATSGDAFIKNKPTIPSAVTESTVSGWGFTKNTGTYSKPIDGIPKSDLASAVQTSLGKADTALQSHQDISDKLNKTGDGKDVTVTYTSSDVVDGNATAWTSVSTVISGEKLSSLFAKVSQMFKNIRYLYKLLGTTDISQIGGGTVTGAIANINSNIKPKSVEWTTNTYSGSIVRSGNVYTLNYQAGFAGFTAGTSYVLGKIKNYSATKIYTFAVFLYNGNNDFPQGSGTVQISGDGTIKLYCASNGYNLKFSCTWVCL